MEIRIRQTGQIVTEDEFRQMNSMVSIPRPITEESINILGGDVVFEGPQATGGTVYQYSMRLGVEEANGKWFTKYVLGPIFTDTPDKTAQQQEAEYKQRKDEEQATSVRASRNQLLKDTDWTQVNDAPVNVQAWAQYRQLLRDIPLQTEFPWTVQWPDKP